MANPTRFVPVNLNKSYGQHHPPRSSSSASSTPAPSPYHHANGGTGPRGRGMVVLSRPRGAASTAQKAGSKLSVPAPLNLPSLRKEHERFDPSGGSGSSSGAASSALGSAHGHSALGWSKPLEPARPGSGETRVGSPAYAPAVAAQRAGPTERSVLLRGEDFPSLKATTFLVGQKQKDAGGQKQRAGAEHVERPSSEPSLTMRPLGRSSHGADVKELGGAEGAVRGGPKSEKVDGFLAGPIPIIQFKHTSDWADDERDTSSGILDRGRDHGLSRAESGRGYDYSEGRLSRDLDLGGTPEKDYRRMDTFGRDSHTPSKGASSWRMQHGRDGFGARESGIDRDVNGLRFSNHNRDGVKDNNVKYGHSMYADSTGEGSRSGHADKQYSWRSLGHGQNSQTAKDSMEMYDGRRSELNEVGRHLDASGSWHKADCLQKSSSKIPSARGFSSDIPVLNLSRENRNYSSNGNTPLDNDAFESRDPFSGALLGDVNSKVFKRKKDVLKQVDFHDPVRESFEAELERVQKLQEEERQRALQEHARALEIARKEEEERERMLREEEERRIRLEEEAREVAWRAEQERLSAAKRAEEQRLAREEEKKRMFMEEERRKEAALKKLRELEDKIAARRKAEEAAKESQFVRSAAGDPVVEVERRDLLKAADAENWEDGERMVEHVTNSALYDHSQAIRVNAVHSTIQHSVEGNSPFLDRGKLTNSWKNEPYDEGNCSSLFLDLDNDSHTMRRDAFSPGRVLPRKGFFTGQGGGGHFRQYHRGGLHGNAHTLGDHHSKGHRWSTSGESDRYDGNSFIDHDILDNRNHDGVGEQGHSRGSPHVLYTEILSPRSEMEGYSNSVRARHTLRQPRVFPPPSFNSVHKCFLRDEPNHHSQTFFEGESTFQAAKESEKDRAYENESHGQGRYLDVSFSQEKTMLPKQSGGNTSRCGSQSSVSVSNPPSSPMHLSHDDFNDSVDFPSLPASADGRPISFSDAEHVVTLESGKTNLRMASGSSQSIEEWSSDNNGQLQDQEEYDEDDDYHEEGEPHEGDENILDIGEDFVLSSDLQSASIEMGRDQKVLGFNDGVEVMIPNDDFDESSLNIENSDVVEMAPGGAVLNIDSSDAVKSSEYVIPLESSFAMESESFSKLVMDTEKALQSLDTQTVISTSALNNLEKLPSDVSPVQDPATSAFDVPKSYSVGVLPSPQTSTIQHPETSTKLHFGLFSGPSLIPSPVPAIQIGSIQMPLNIHSPIGPPHLQSSQPPFFQFGQLRYSSPMSQGILPINFQSVPYSQSTVPARISSDTNIVCSVSSHAMLGPVQNAQKGNTSSSIPAISKPKYGGKHFDNPSNKVEFNQASAVYANQQSVDLSSPGHGECSPGEKNQSNFERSTPKKTQENHMDSSKNSGVMIDSWIEHDVEPHFASNPSQFLTGDKSVIRSRGSGFTSAGRGKRYIYAVKSRAPHPQFSGSGVPRGGYGNDRRVHRNFRRTEFRVRRNNHKRVDASDALNYNDWDEKPHPGGGVDVSSLRSGSKRDVLLNKSSATMFEPESSYAVSNSPQVAHLDGRRKAGRELMTKTSASSMASSRTEEVTQKKTENIEEDVEAPLESGVVRIYKQPGILTPSDEDDFIKVRSKRQMLNDKREQREKEIKAKSRNSKNQASRKPHAVYQTNTSSKPNKVVTGGVSKGASISLEPAVIHSNGHSTAYSVSSLSQTLTPIGTPSVNADSGARSPTKKSVSTNSASVVPSALTEIVDSVFEKNAPFENAVASLGSWSDAHVKQQVMTLTQTQLEEAMKPECFDSCGALVVEKEKTSTIKVTQDKPFTNSGNPLSSLLAGERIQFGAVTTPSFIPSVSRAVQTPSGIGPLVSASCKIEDSKENLLASENDHAMIFEKGKKHVDSSVHLEDSESEAEAAASAIAVAAISSDEALNGGSSATSVSIPVHENFGSSNTRGMTSQGGRINGKVTSLTSADESLPVTLPADLSVETPLPLWPVLPTPLHTSQTTSSTMFSQFPGPPPSHFPCFDVNPMLRGPIITFGPQDESGSTQSQPQRSSPISPGPLGAWSHSGMDSFYGPPAGFSGHFISPPAAVPGVQAPPQMVFYNHFPTLAPFGVGIMGTTFISSSKQPDWKHNPVSSTMSVNQGDNDNMTTAQHMSPNIPPSLQHISPASSVVQMATPLPMFDFSPFQSNVDVPAQARWPHIPPAPMHGMPFPPLTRSQVDGAMQVDVGQTSNSSSASNNFLESRPTAESEPNFTFQADSAAQLPDELGLVDPSSSMTAQASTSGSSYPPLSGNGNDENAPNGAKSFPRGAGSSSRATAGGVTSTNHGRSNSNDHGTVTASKPRSSPQQSQQHHHLGYADKRGCASSQRMPSGGEWHRRAGFQGRSHGPLGVERNFPPSKVKQIYVAKSPAGGAAGTN